MLARPSSQTAQRPPPPFLQRSFSHADHRSLQNHPFTRPPLPSRLHSARSASGPGQFVDLTRELGGEGGPVEQSHSAWVQTSRAWAQNAGLLAGENELVPLDLDETDDRPRKKVKLDIGAPTVTSPVQLPEQPQQDAAHRIVPGQPIGLPPRSLRPVTTRTGSKNASEIAARKADGIVPPQMATKLPAPKKVADFSPWTGAHPEDNLNEQVVKSGHSDKGPLLNQSESSSARLSVWPNLSQKNNIALQTLSHLYTQVLEKRQTLGRCTAPSTFKPPPRVTVTDTKREAWLRDLSNPKIPLRRQSRTIPHGIRGKLLMEQCLAKWIPLQRAVWLAKCVGANELRTFRRKGVSGAAAAQGEAKWIREWTGSVEIFLEDIIHACGQTDWRAKADYAIRLTTALFAEGLLDKPHHLDWVVTSFATSSLDQMPMWMVIVQIHWRDIVAFGRRGRKLAQAVLERLHNIVQRGHSIFDAVKLRLEKLLVLLSVQDRGCLIMPTTWHKYKYLLASQPTKPTPLGSNVQDIHMRNERLIEPTLKTTDNTRNPLVQLYCELDTIDLNVDVPALAHKCSFIVPDLSDLVSALLQWSATTNRRGIARLNLVQKLIVHIHRQKFDCDGAILAFLWRTDVAAAVEPDKIFAVIIDLVQNDCFSPGRYLQWLIASGAASSREPSRLATGLLSALPVEMLPQHLQNTRLSLLRRLGLAVDETSAMDAATAEIERTLLDNSLRTDAPILYQDLSGSAKLVLRYRIGSKILSLAKDTGMYLRAFCVFRDVLVNIGDSETLYKLLDASIQTEDFRLIASIADTVDAHALEFAIIGELSSLVDGLVKRYRILRTQHPLERSSIYALRGLLKRLSGKTAVVKLLTSDLLAYEQQNPNAVCSPASDSLIGMHAGSLESDEEIDAVFASGNSMDEQLMQRIFTRIMQKREKYSVPVTEMSSKICGWLNQLRTLDSVTFENLARHYLANAVQLCSNGSLPQEAYALVASDCVGLETVLEVMKEALAPNSVVTAVKMLAAPLKDNGVMSVPEQYHYHRLQCQYRRDTPLEVCATLAKSLNDAELPAEAGHLVDLILELAISAPGGLVSRLDSAPHNHILLRNVGDLWNSILYRGRPDLEDTTLSPQVVAEIADALSGTFCADWLHFHAASQPSAQNDEQVKGALIGAIIRDSPVWPQLLGAAKPETVKAIHEWARERILSNQVKPESVYSGEEKQLLDRACTVLDVTYATSTQEDDAHTLSAVADRLGALDRRLSEAMHTSSEWHESVGAVTKSLELLLHLTILYWQTPVDNEPNFQARMSVASALAALMINPALQARQDTVDYIFDVVSTVTDRMSIEHMSMLARGVGSVGSRDGRLVSLLGNMPSPDAWLTLASRTHPLGSQQPRVLSRQAPQASQAGVKLTPATAGGQGPTPQAKAQPQKGGVLQQRQAAQAMELRYSPYVLRRWEIMSDPTPVIGENDASISLALFGARKV